MGVAGAHHPGIGLPRQIEIVGVFALAAYQRVVLLAPDRLSDAVFLQRNGVFLGRNGRVIEYGLSSKVPILRDFTA
jgi:hypothetical protein